MNNESISYKEFSAKRFLFKGNSCFPLSPCDENKKKKGKEQNIINRFDQVKLILKELGHQTDK